MRSFQKSIVVLSVVLAIAGIATLCPRKAHHSDPPATAESRQVIRSEGAVATSVLSEKSALNQPADFDQWLGQYLAAPALGRMAMLERGIALAKERRTEMALLIREDPKAALMHALSPRKREGLPPEIVSLLEKPVAGEGSYGLVAICDHEASGSDDVVSHVKREAVIEGEYYVAHVYGRRLAAKSDKTASLAGVALDGHIALYEDSVLVRTPNEMPEGMVPVGGYALTFKGQTTVVADKPALDALIQEKQTPVDLPLAASGPGFDPGTPPTGPAPPTTAYNEYRGDYAHEKGPKTVFVFLIEPSDGAAWTNPPSFATLDSQLNTSSQDYYNASYRQTWFGPKYVNVGLANEVLVPRLVVSPVIHLSRSTSALMDSIGSQAFDAKALIEAMGGAWTNGGANDPDNFDRWVVMSNTKLVSSTGLAYVGGAIAWTGGSLSGSVAEHEWGHNWGVGHANSWDVPVGAQPRATSGTNGEYSDGWDIMGGGSMTTAFNTLFCEQLGFLERSRGEVLDVTASGTYRLYDYIDPFSRNATSNVRALLLPMEDFTLSKRVFLGFGHVSGTDGGKSRSDWNRNALTVHCALSDGSNRIDTTPFSQQIGDANDSSVKIGRTYTEGANVNGTQMYGGFSVTPVLRGSTVVTGNTHEWMDVVINYGTPSPNPPVASFAQTTFSATSGSPLTLAVAATDPDGDTLAYDWDFGDGTYSITNSATQNKSWSTIGLYLVNCTVSDMKGRSTVVTCWVNVGAIAYRVADNPASTLGGLYYRYYEGTFSTMPVFNNLLPVKSGTVSALDLSPRNRNDNFAFQFDGFIDVPTTDIYTFKVTSDDGARLYIGNTLVVDNNALQSTAFSKTGNIALNAGKHKIRIEFFHKDGAEALSIAWGTRTSAMANITSASFSQTDPSTNVAPVVAITQPVNGAAFLVNSDILLQATASDADGIASVVFFADGSYLGTDTTAPFSYSWPKVSVGSKSVVALAYDTAGRWSQSLPVSVNVISPTPQPCIGLNMNTKNVAGGTMFFNDVSGAVYQQSNWSNLVGLTGSAANVKDYLGTATTMSVSWIGSANANYGDGLNDADTSTGPGRMFKALAEIRDDESNRPTLTATNVPYPQYDIYVYFDQRGSDTKDTLPQRFTCTPTEGATPADIYGKNSLSSTDAVGDYPTYDTWVGFKESTATTTTAPISALLGNYVVFRNVRSSGFTVKAERQIAGTPQKLGFNAVQIVRSNPAGPLVFIRQTGGSTAVTEGGAGDAYTVALGYAPDTNVTISVNSGSQMIASPTSLTFTPQNWSAPQSVNVSAVDDAVAEGPHSGTITHTVSAAGNYNGIAASSLTVAITDNDQPLVTVRASGNPAEAASPTPGLFQFTRGGVGSLVAPMTVTFQMSGTADLSADYALSGASVSYNSATGAGTVMIPSGQAQAFLTLTPTNDVVKESPETGTLTLTASAGYVIGSPGAATLSISDDDVVDYFTEYFEDAAAFDLNGKSVTFTPAAGIYTVSTATVGAFPSGTSGFANYNKSGMTAGNSDDGWWSQTLAVAFPFFGGNQTVAYIGTNGYITFWTGNSLVGGNLSTHFTPDIPRISGISRDLSPLQGGNISYKRDTTAGQQRSIFFWDAVRNYNVNTTVSFQIELFDDGRIRLTSIGSTLNGACVAGLNSGVAATMPTSPFDGTGAQPFYESNLSGSGFGTNTPPQFASIPQIIATVGQAFSYAVVCTDSENNPLTLTAPTKPAWLSFSSNGDGTATLSGIPVSSASNPVVLQVSDGTTSVQQAFSVAVVQSGGNTAPQITSTPITQASAGTIYNYAITATDADGHALAISSTELPAWLTLTDAGNGTATLGGTVPFTGLQSHPVTLTVSDGLASSVQSFTITLNLAPVITMASPASGFVKLTDRNLTLELEATIADDALPVGSTVTTAWSLVSGPGSVNFGTPSATNTSAKFTAAGWYILRLTASDGASSATRDISVFVEADGDAVVANGQQGWWKFNEGSGTTAADSSGNGRALTLTNATMSGDGYAGKSYTGDASAIQYAESATLSCPTLVTLSAWVFATATPATSDRYIFNFHTSTNPRLRLYMASGTSRLRLFSDRTTDGIWEAQYSVPAYEWFHVAVSYDTSSASASPVVYINGRAVATTVIGTPASGAQVSSSALRIGGNSSSGNSWLGRLDEARVFSRLLPAAEIPLLQLVAPINAAPTISVGLAGDTAVGSPFDLAGTATDDGAPNPPAAIALLWGKSSGPGAVQFGNAEAAATTVTFDAVGPYVLRLRASDGAVAVSQEITITATSTIPTYANWIANFPSLAGQTAPNGDPDGDGIPNLIEYALSGGNPAIANTGILPTVSTTKVGGSEYLTLNVSKNSLAVGITYEIEVCGDLTTWDSGVGHTVIITDTASTLVVRDHMPIGDGIPKRFIRLKISLQ